MTVSVVHADTRSTEQGLRPLLWLTPLRGVRWRPLID
jgi:hypothetical protein